MIICAQKRAKYVLAEPKPDVKDMYVKDFQSQLLADAEAFIEFITNSFYVQMAHPAPLINTIIACSLINTIIANVLQMFSILPGCMKIQYTVKPLYIH